MTLYYASILDYKGEEIIFLQTTGTAKHSAFLANQYVNNCPPAQGFRIHKFFITNHQVANVINQGRGL